MATTDDDLGDLNLEDEEEQQTTPTGEGDEGDLEGKKPDEGAPAEEDLKAAIAALRADNAEMKGKVGIIDQLAPLFPTLKAALEKFAAPDAKPDAKPDPEAVKAFGTRIQQTLLTGDPEEAARLFTETVRQISGRQIDDAVTRVGGPFADRAADWTLSSYLSSKKDEAGPNGEKLHGLIAKELALTADEKAWIGSGPAKQVRDFLDSKYEGAAGRVLIRSSSKRPRATDLSGSGAGGGARGGSTLLPGLNPAEQRHQEKLAALLWPDEKVRAQKLKEMRDALTAEAS